jgi:hypothetical protein
MLYKKVKIIKMFQKMQNADIVKFFVYIPGYVDFLLARSGWNWFSCDDGGVYMYIH